MNTKRYNFLNSLICCYFLVVTPSFALDVKAVFNEARPSVVLIVAYDNNDQPKSMGSGFFVGDSNTIATNFHVIESANSLMVQSSDGQTGRAISILGLDERNDLVLIEVDITGTPLNLALAQPDIGEDIIAIGNPSGLEGTVSTGIVSGIRTEEGSQYFQITAPISPGSSGGPIINEDATVIGVASFYLDGAQSLNFAMPAAYVKKLYDSRAPQSLSVLMRKAPSKPKQIESNVKIMYASTTFSGFREYDYFEASVVNLSSRPIKNVKVVVNYFLGTNNIPIHYSLHNFKDLVPPGLSLRVKRKVRNLNSTWNAVATILDYDIVSDQNARGLLEFDE